MDDAELVASAIAESPAGFAAIYDRYVDRIFDYARSVLRSDADAADVTQDTFLVASQRLDQLREPSRLRPWLYAIARSHSFRVLRERQRSQVSSDIDEAEEMTAPESGIDAQQLVWAASAGLAASDRDILDLHLRQGLDGQELGDALGMSANAANVALHRVRARLEQSIGAVLLAKTSKNECVELDELMAGGLDALARKRIARHLGACATCDDRRRALTSPSVLFAATPLALAPVVLRDSVLRSVGSERAATAAEVIDWGADGFPIPAPILDGAGVGAGAEVGFEAVAATRLSREPGTDRLTRPSRRRMLMSSAAVVLLAVVGALFMLRGSTSSSVEIADSAAPIPSTTRTSATTTTPPGAALAVVSAGTSASLGDAPASPTATVSADPDVAPAPAPPPVLGSGAESPTLTSTVVETPMPVTTTVSETPPPDTTISATTVVPDAVPLSLPVISPVEVVCASTMLIVVDIAPADSITGSFETLDGLSEPLIAHPTIAGRFTAELAIGEGRVTPRVVATGPGGTHDRILADCIVIG